MALAVQPGQGQHHLKQHFPSEGRLEQYLLLIPLCCSQSSRSHTVGTGGWHTHGITPFSLLSPSHRPSSTRILLCQVVPSSQAICTAAASPGVSRVQSDPCSPACSWHLCSALETEEKALERQASSCSQHHALVSASHCTNGQHTRVIYSPFFT